MPRLWMRNHFTDHPLYFKNQSKAQRPPEVWANTSQDKIKVICTSCLEHRVGTIIQEEEATAGTRLPRTREAIITELYSAPVNSPGRMWVETRSETLLVHLRSCPHVSSDVRDAAAQELSINSTDMQTPRRARHTHQSSNAIVSPQPVYAAQQLPAEPSFISQWQSQSQYASRPPSSVSMRVDTPTGGMMPVPYSNYPTSLVPFQRASSPSGTTYSGSSFQSRRSSLGVQPAKLIRSASGSKRPYSPFGDITTQPPVWTVERQTLFENALGRLTAAAGFPYNWVTNPEFIQFCQDFIPAARVPSRKVLSNRIIPNMLRNIRGGIREKIRGQLVTVQCDGWTGANSHHLVAYMITTGSQVYTVSVEDTTVMRKTAELSLLQMIKIIEHLENDWGVKVIAFTTDASGEARKARRLLQLKYPHLVTPDCYAHQINLIVGDYFKTNGPPFLEFSAAANELITWLRSKTQILGLIKQNLASRGKRPMSVIRPVPTRWTAYYLAYRRLLDLRTTLEFIVVDDANKNPGDRQVIQGDRAARLKAGKMVELIKSPLFWNSIARIKHHLAPLAIAANITQSAHCRLDEVLLTFASLAMEFKKLTDPQDIDVREALLRSIEQRWEKSDQDVFIAAVILNPFTKLSPFNRNKRLVSLGSVNALISRLWTRFFSGPPPHDLYEEIRHYLDCDTEEFVELSITCERLKALAAARGESPNPIQAYLDISVPGEQHTGLAKIAIHILSICPNSASCERLFSTFGLILTKLRTRLSNTKLLDLAECKLHIRDQSVEKEQKKKLRQRVFGIAAESNQASSSTNLGTGIGSTPSQPGVSIPPESNTTPSTSLGDILARPSLPMAVLTPTNSEFDDDPEDPLAPLTSASNNSLRTLTSRYMGMVDNDIDLPDPIPDPRPSASTANSTARSTTSSTAQSTAASTSNPTSDSESLVPAKRTISELFDFRSDHWVNHSQRGAIGSLDDELEYYELLDLDAEGEPDNLEYDLDECLESVLTM